MLESRVFNIVKVKPGHGAGIEETGLPDQIITYHGDQIEVILDQ